VREKVKDEEDSRRVGRWGREIWGALTQRIRGGACLPLSVIMLG